MAELTTIKPTLLVVDDSRLMRLAARKILKNEFEIIEAEDGEVAWDILQDNTDIALVMSDLSMPNLDGLGLLQKLRTSDRADLQALPVIIVTGAEDDDGSKTAAFAAGASDFITKPFESVQLLARTKSQAQQQRMQQALQDSEVAKQQPAQDSLTGLLNKQSFLNTVEEHLAYAIRHRTELSVLVLRLEKYKIMFLRRGKQETEQVLRRLGELATQRKRREDIVARISLDTVAILLPSANSIGANQVANQLREAISQQDFADIDATHPFCASIGISRLDTHRDLKAEELIADALNNLDTSKNRIDEPTDAAKPQPPPARVEPIVASSEELLGALQALANDAQPSTSADQLVRAVMPVLRLWNSNNNHRFDTLINTLASALDEGEESTDTPAPIPKPSSQSH